MNFLKQSAFIAVFAFMGLPTVQAERSGYFTYNSRYGRI